MAYLVSLSYPCQLCKRPATKRLFNAVNASLGVYCNQCAQRELRAMQAREAKQFADALPRWGMGR